MQIQVKQSYKGKNISSLYRFPFVYSKRPNIGPADYWSLTLEMANYEKQVEQEAAYPIPISLYNCYRTVRHEKRGIATPDI